MVKTQVSFDNPGTVPPVFVAGSFTEWQPVELNEPAFSKEFDLKPGSYQYKFRLGTGEWWVCDQSKPQATDQSGNTNNILTIEPEPEIVKEEVAKPAQQQPVSIYKEDPNPSDDLSGSTSKERSTDKKETILSKPPQTESVDKMSTEPSRSKMNGSASLKPQEALTANGNISKPVVPSISDIKKKVEPAQKAIEKAIPDRLPEDKASSGGLRWIVLTAAIAVPIAIAWFMYQ